MSVIGDSNNIDAKDVTRLKYLERVLKESMRLFPIAPFMGRRIRGDIQLSKHWKKLNSFICMILTKSLLQKTERSFLKAVA